MRPEPGHSYPQPREGISGVLRDSDDLLSLEEEALAIRAMMGGLARVLRSAVMVGNPAPVVARMSERMRTPVPGDLVVETSSMRRRDEDWYKGFGILLEHRQEWWTTDEQWAAEIERERAAYEDFLRGPYSHPGDGPFDPAAHERLTDHAWYIQYGSQPVEVCRWVDCEFMVVPVDPEFAAVQVGTRDGSAVTFTRDDLLGSLADSGFTLRRPEG